MRRGWGKGLCTVPGTDRNPGQTAYSLLLHHTQRWRCIWCETWMRLVSVWQSSSYSHLQTNFSSAAGHKSAKPRVQLKLVRLSDTTKWTAPLGLLLNIVPFKPLQYLYTTFLFYTVNTSSSSFVHFSGWSSVHAKVPLCCPHTDLPAAGEDVALNRVGSCYRCQSRLFYSAVGWTHKHFGKLGSHSHVIDLAGQPVHK